MTIRLGQQVMLMMAAVLIAMPAAHAHGTEKQHLLILLGDRTPVRGVWTLKRTELAEMMGVGPDFEKRAVSKLVAKHFSVATGGVPRTLRVESVEVAEPKEKGFIEVLFVVDSKNERNATPIEIKFDFSGGDHALSPMVAKVIDAEGKTLATHLLNSKKPQFRYP